MSNANEHDPESQAFHTINSLTSHGTFVLTPRGFVKVDEPQQPVRKSRRHKRKRSKDTCGSDTIVAAKRQCSCACACSAADYDNDSGPIKDTSSIDCMLDASSSGCSDASRDSLDAFRMAKSRYLPVAGCVPEIEEDSGLPFFDFTHFAPIGLGFSTATTTTML